MGLPATPLNRTGIGLAEQLIGLQRGDVLIMMAQKSAHREGQTTLREAKRLGIPTILLTNATDSRFSKEASVVIHVPRGGEKGKIPLHGTVLLCGDDCVIRRLHRAAAHHQVDEAHQRASPWAKAGQEKQLIVSLSFEGEGRVGVIPHDGSSGTAAASRQSLLKCADKPVTSENPTRAAISRTLASLCSRHSHAFRRRSVFR